jgi:16S rRNA (uracil1498-N3)-methyltransferase
MTRRRFYAAPAAINLEDQSVFLDQTEARHLADVLRLGPGAEVFVFDGQGREFRCEVIDPKKATLRVIEPVPPPHAESPLSLTLAIALLKGEKFDLVVQKATELGVTRIVPVLTARADVRIADASAAAKRIARWNRLAMEAAKQCGRAVVPECKVPVEFSALVSEPAGFNQRVMFTERDGGSFDTIESGSNVIALVGPEGGWADEELAQARANDWTLVTLGGRTLRAETAAITVIALLQHRLGDLR